jgi:hypothetical protein
MTAKSPDIGEILEKLIAKAIDGPAALVRALCVATLSVAEYIVSCIDCGIASDIHDIKESLLHKIKAEGATATADAKKKLAEAIDATNQATLHKRNGRIAQAELAQREAGAAKTRAEADATRGDAETRRLQAEAEAKARLTEAKASFVEAVAKLRQEGGNIFFDREALENMLDSGLGQTLPEPTTQDPQVTDAKVSDCYGVNQLPDAVVFVTLFPQATTVQIAGDFNNWQAATTPMQRVGDSGVWQAKVKLAPGIYRYRLVVDGVWQQDPYNDRSEPNPYGGENSMFKVE